MARHDEEWVGEVRGRLRSRAGQGPDRPPPTPAPTEIGDPTGAEVGQLGTPDDAPGEASRTIRWGRAGIVAGIVATLALLPGSVIVGIVFGVLAREVGMSGLQALTMSVLVSGGAAQFIALDLWASPVPVTTLVLTTLVVNLRHLLLGASLQAWLGPLRGWRRWLTLHFLTDESWALSEVARRRGERDVAFLVGSGLVAYGGWIVGTVVGYLVGDRVGGLVGWDIGFIFTALFVALLVGIARGRQDIAPFAVAAAVAIITQRLVGGTWYILCGGIAGSLAGAFSVRANSISAPRGGPAGGPAAPISTGRTADHG